jgi:O-antigen ligase
MLAVPTDLSRVIRITVDGHNSVLDILYDTGLIGLAIYVALGLALLRELRAKADLFGDVAGLAAIWWCYIAAYYMSTEMFNGFVYMVGSRWYSLIITGAILALPARPGNDGTEAS